MASFPDIQAVFFCVIAVIVIFLLAPESSRLIDAGHRFR